MSRYQGACFVSRASNIEYLLAEVSMIRWDGDGSVLNENQTIGGYRYQLWACVKSYRANVSTGRLEEELIDETPPDKFHWAGIGIGRSKILMADLEAACVQIQRHRTMGRLQYNSQRHNREPRVS